MKQTKLLLAIFGCLGVYLEGGGGLCIGDLCLEEEGGGWGGVGWGVGWGVYLGFRFRISMGGIM